jgi:PAS domain S-box-containing protein
VLIAEDAQDEALLLVRELERGGYAPHYRLVETSAAMREALADCEWDAIICAYRLERFGSFEALDVHRELALDAPLIVVGGAIGEEAAVEVIHAGARDYVAKDNLAARLCASVARGLEKTAEERRGAREKPHRERHEALGEGEERFRSAFEAAPIGMALVGLEDGRWLEVNGPLCEIVGYSEDELLALTWQEVTHPDDLDADLQQVQQMLRGEIRYFQMEKRYLRKDGRVVWVLLSSSLVRDADGKPLYGIAQVEDITKRKRAEQALKQSEELYRTVIEQATENIFLVDIESKRIVESNRAFREALGYTAEELGSMTLYDLVAADPESVDRNLRRALQKRRAFVGQRRYRRKGGSFLEVEASVSVVLRDGRETLCAVAHDVTERVRAQELLEERLTALSRLGARLTLDLPVQDTLDAMAQSVVRASTAKTCSVALIDEETGALGTAGSYGLSEDLELELEAVWQEVGTEREAVRTRRPVLARRGSEHVARDRSLRHTVFVVPLVSRGRALGAITFGYPPGQEPGENEKIFLGAIADHAAVAVENARLFAEARGKAALEERQRLARELHDSVSQALYGISLGAETAREALEEDPGEVAEPLDYVIALSEAGIAEMRALIFELHPESLQEEGLCVALEKQAEAVRARHKLRVEVELCDEPDAALEVKEAVYRIAQEALNNAAKHADAKVVSVGMECVRRRVVLEVRDDGVGFDPEGDFRGHLGLRSMRERASKLGGTLRVNSAPGAGTVIRARIPL